MTLSDQRLYNRASKPLALNSDLNIYWTINHYLGCCDEQNA